ncbi:unnamed protein product [Angiostrongylus costaricensis]|uniref:PAZ domain-containing protein n=1 Tax=Angiostrongylus costaricensis TaxID=334426 RepID=A0A0R3PM20_ANGCS|nr:unnamed protein product [Angiostrongylus costaricensis]
MPSGLIFRAIEQHLIQTIQNSGGVTPNFDERFISSAGTSQNAALSMPNAAMLFSGANGSPESLNALRNQQYLAQLARHQSELTQYSAKQMEYLDQQRRYQQSMIDHQAGAALLMQKQQQDLINEQMKQLKASYGNNDNLTNDNTVGGRVLTAKAKGVKNRAFADDDIIANDEHLREYFKEKYGINLSSEASTLTDEERETLKALKELLSKNKEETIERGVFKTMESLKSKQQNGTVYIGIVKMQNNFRKIGLNRSRTHGSKTAKSSELSSTCSQCIPHNIDMMKGAWTQMYGNPSVIKKIFGTIMSLERMQAANGRTVLTSKGTACVGLESKNFRAAAIHLKISFNHTYLEVFRYDSKGNELHEVRFSFEYFDISIVEADTLILYTVTPMCLVKAGPVDVNRYEILVLAETSGKNACRSYHVFARNTDEFNRRQFDYVSEFMENVGRPCITFI